MSALSLLVYWAIGRLLIWFTQINGLLEPVKKLHPKIEQLINCDLCLGFWVYLVLNICFSVVIVETNFLPVDLILNAMLSTFVMHLIRLGWDVRFGN